jgi:hypothetical protein
MWSAKNDYQILVTTVAGGRGHVFHIQTEEHREDESALGHRSGVVSVDVADLKDIWNVRW